MPSQSHVSSSLPEQVREGFSFIFVAIGSSSPDDMNTSLPDKLGRAYLEQEEP
ncbi:MAG TPA: hypothetical protein VIP53_07620 [Nitrososphaera sp.]